MTKLLLTLFMVLASCNLADYDDASEPMPEHLDDIVGETATGLEEETPATDCIDEYCYDMEDGTDADLPLPMP